MTEDEARQKWCPMVRHSQIINSIGPTPAYNRKDNDLPESSKCIASDCMMWRWDVVAIGAMENPDGTLYQEFGESPINGCCGLGGKS